MSRRRVRTIWVTALLAVFSGTSLTALNVTGFLVGPDRHPLTTNSTATKAGIALRPAGEVLDELERFPPLNDMQDVQRLTATFSAGIMHYWPSPGEIDSSVFYSPTENWVIFLASWIETLGREAGLLEKPLYARLERYEYGAAIRKGVGFCSQVAKAVSDFAQKRGHEAGIVGLDGHVVAELKIQTKTYIVDADYGVAIPHSIGEVENDPTIISPYYTQAGYPADTVSELIRIYGRDGNQVRPAGTYLSIYTKAVWAKWVIPAVLILSGALMLLGLRVIYVWRGKKHFLSQVR